MKSRIIGSFSSMEIILDLRFFFFQDQQGFTHISDCYGEKVSKLTMKQGASIAHTLNEECTHVDQLVPLKKDLVDSGVVKKYCVLKTWLEYKFGDQLKSLLEVAGAKSISFQEFSSISLVYFQCWDIFLRSNQIGAIIALNNKGGSLAVNISH